jgi:hypothetical protein
MTFSPAAIATPRRNVAQRIERFLNGLERAGRPPNRRELYHLGEAFRKLEESQYPEAEDAMLKAERIAPIPQDAATAVPENQAVSIRDLRCELRRILQGTLA